MKSDKDLEKGYCSSSSSDLKPIRKKREKKADQNPNTKYIKRTIPCLNDKMYMLICNVITECKIIGMFLDDENENVYRFTVKYNRLTKLGNEIVPEEQRLENVKLGSLFPTPELVCEMLLKNIAKI